LEARDHKGLPAAGTRAAYDAGIGNFISMIDVCSVKIMRDYCQYNFSRMNEEGQPRYTFTSIAQKLTGAKMAVEAIFGHTHTRALTYTHTRSHTHLHSLTLTHTLIYALNHTQYTDRYRCIDLNDAASVAEFGFVDWHIKLLSTVEHTCMRRAFHTHEHIDVEMMG
jgi:hypothetical protein